MGLMFSRIFGINEQGQGRGLEYDLPEGCVAEILKSLSPVDVCKLACLNRTFRAAASSDYVWCQKLPGCHEFLLSKLELQDRSRRYLSHKRIFELLCQPISLEGGTRVVWLDKITGGLCMSVSARAMAITGIDDHRYWRWIPCDESRWEHRWWEGSSQFHEVAYLQQLWWVEIDGMIAFQLPADEYCLFFRLQLGRSYKRFGRRMYMFDRVHGWGLKPVRFSLSTSDGQHVVRECLLEDDNGNRGNSPGMCIRGNWVSVYVGMVNVKNENKPMEIKFSMTQIDCTHSKGGLCLDSVTIMPTKLWKGGSAAL